MTAIAQLRPTPVWRTVAAGFGLAWSLFGVFRFSTTSFASPAELAASGMTAEQAALYVTLPVWMTLAFALGTIGGTIGSILLLRRSPLARPALAASLAGYLILYAGDWALGVFAAFGPSQVIILTFVVAVAAGLLWLARDLRS